MTVEEPDQQVADASNKTETTDTNTSTDITPQTPIILPTDPKKKRPRRLRKFLRAIKEIDGLLLLIGLLATASISYLVDRRNTIDRHASASVAVIDQALQTVISITEFDTDEQRHDFSQRMTTLRFLHYFGEYQVDVARGCLDLLIADVSRFSKGALPERSVGGKDKILAPHLAIFEDARALKVRIAAWKAHERTPYAVIWASRDDLFDACFQPLAQR